MRQWIFRFHKTQGIYWLAGEQLASEEELCNMELIPKLIRLLTSYLPTMDKEDSVFINVNKFFFSTGNY